MSTARIPSPASRRMASFTSGSSHGWVGGPLRDWKTSSHGTPRPERAMTTSATARCCAAYAPPSPKPRKPGPLFAASAEGMECVVKSTRTVRVEIGGQTVAESKQPRLLFETGLPTRYYLPVEDVRMDLLEPTETSSVCPYKGTASYWKLAGDPSGRDVAWSYQDPIGETPKIRGLIAFFNERVDGLFVDDDLQDKPKTAWS